MTQSGHRRFTSVQTDPRTPFHRPQIPAVIDFENRRSPKPLGWAMRRRSRAGGKPANARSRQAIPKRRNATTVRAESESERLRRERDDALKQQTAASEVLRVISSSPGDLESVFRSILVNANRICEAHFGTIFRYDGKALVVTAWEGVPPEYLALLQSGPLPIGERTATGRAAKSKQVVHIADLSAELPRTKADQLRTPFFKL